MLTVEILKNICPYADNNRLKDLVDPLNKHIPNIGINSLLRIRHFIAQVAHESASFNYLAEIASGSAYEERKDLGNINSGDGIKFKGRGLIQITGRANYEKCSQALFGNDILLSNPETLEKPDYAVDSACWFWNQHNLNALADADNIVAITKIINGGQNGLVSRKDFYNRTKLYITEV